MLSAEALKERMWGPFPALRVALENEDVPDRYYGFTSVSDNMFDALQRAAVLAVLIKEFAPKIKADATSVGAERMHHDLALLMRFLEHQRSFFDDSVEAAKRLSADL